MEEIMTIAQTLQSTPDLFQWVVLALIVFVIFTNRNRIESLIDAAIDERKERKRSNIILSELIRNNTSALDNNTAALNMVKNDRGETRRMLEHHEELSKARDEETLASVGAIRSIVNENKAKISVVEDRVDRDTGKPGRK